MQRAPRRPTSPPAPSRIRRRRPPFAAGAASPSNTIREEVVITEKKKAQACVLPGGRRPVAVGETVVYAAHGVGRVVSCERMVVGGTERDCLVVDLAAGLRVTLPFEEAADRLRAVVDDEQLADVQKTLGEEPGRRDGPWTRRIKESKAKLSSGRATDLAEIIRDGARFEQPAQGPRLSPGERRVYVQARQLLAREICSARGIEPDEAEAWIEAQTAVAAKAGD